VIRCEFGAKPFGGRDPKGVYLLSHWFDENLKVHLGSHFFSEVLAGSRVRTARDVAVSGAYPRFAEVCLDLKGACSHVCLMAWIQLELEDLE
jgi:hypothetical protein